MICVLLKTLFSFLFHYNYQQLSGVAILGVGIWILADPNLEDYIEVIHTTDQEYFKITAYILIAFGAFVFLVGFCGCCGAIRNSKCLLGFVSTFQYLFTNSKTKTILSQETGLHFQVMNLFWAWGVPVSQSAETCDWKVAGSAPGFEGPCGTISIFYAPCAVPVFKKKRKTEAPNCLTVLAH